VIIEEPDEPEDDESEEFEAIMTRSGAVQFPGRVPDANTAVGFLNEAVARQHELLDHFGAMLTRSESQAERLRAGRELAEAIANLRVAAALFDTPLPADLEPVPESLEDSSFAEPTGAFDNVPGGELPVSVPLNIELSSGEYDVRVRDAHVYSTGFLLTVDVRLIRDDDRDARWLDLIEYRVSGRWGSSMSEDKRDAISFPAGWRTLSPLRGMTRGEWSFWVATTPGQGDYTLRLIDPMSDTFAAWRFSISAATLASARPLS
jgi:hypothetical protein